ncbi:MULTISPECIES: ribonuclease P protein component [Prevotellaceae]|uniref:ribonuclease P protein component n=1 Tax=Leyella stercorea TaxID=363265 RepID=UPI001F30A429|nr:MULTISPECIES: ribonuclease P protein component [Prevotellaceae]MCF2645896.1 ribonuclease P protein component [Leyella stercorea]MCI6129711.1 ribonuclease P protein component [Prevotella sp.]MCI7370461.1 ribonuclease P protein component [Prevotella sp.]MDD6199163.1 ribonuclease P protein component [Prevotella sp.]MDY3967262.1 ribonuclease P protein component [Prevotella sp.]
MTTSKYSLPQSERINSKKQIDRLFRGGGSKAMTASPLRMVYMADSRQTDSQPSDGHQPMAQMMVSVPKRYFKRAVKRNYVKRQVREAYRLNKHILVNHLTQKADKTVSLCFIWTSDRLLPTAEVMKRMANLLTRLVEKLSANDNKNTPQ